MNKFLNTIRPILEGREEAKLVKTVNNRRPSERSPNMNPMCADII